MNSDERWAYLIALDEDLLKSGVVLSEWCSFIVREADKAFVNGAHLATIIIAVAGIETYLRSQYAVKGKARLIDLIDYAQLPDDLRNDTHVLRRYRNRWVHVDDRWNDWSLITKPDETEQQLESMALIAVRALRRIIYENEWI